jgi:A/G-specific adenine glycosylase
LSEIILQQTRIEQGKPYWERFMKRWPTVEALAQASEDEVLREWQGLGYYSRARNLHEAAKQIVEMGGFPKTLEGIKRLKGVGDYTAAAIGSIAFNLPAAVVDGNVYRVLARHYGIETPINTTEGKKEFTALANSLLPANEASAFNQAMMDFGAVQCTPVNPQCTVCPLQETCVALHDGKTASFPVKRKTLKVQERHLVYIYVRHQGKTAIHRRAAGDIWQGLYEPWLTETVPSGAILLRQGVKHVLTHRILYADFYLWEPAEQPQLPEDYFWIPEADIDQYGVPRLIELLLEELNR